MKMKSPASAQDEQTIEADEVIVVASEKPTNTVLSKKSTTRSKTGQVSPPAWEMSAKDALKVNYLSRAKKDSLEPF